VLLLDEPLSNLDARLRTQLRSEIRRICKESGITTIYVTHDQKEALSMADRVAILDRGRLIQLGPPTYLYRRPASRFVAEFLGETNLIQSTGAQRNGDRLTRLSTPAGPLLSSHAAPGAAPLISIRPEALRILSVASPPPPNSLSGIVVERTYLGETAQHLVELPGAVHLKVALINPAAFTQQGQSLTLTVSPDDVVLLPST